MEEIKASLKEASEGSNAQKSLAYGEKKGLK
jgi:hypothetical protein